MIVRTGGGGPTSNYIRPNSRRLDIARVKDGQIQKLYDVKFRGDTIDDLRRKEYQKIAERHTGNKVNYDEFDIDENCNGCGGPPPTATAPVTEPKDVPSVETGPSFGDYVALTGLGLLTVGLALVPFDGPFGEAAAGAGFAAQASRMGLALAF